MDFKGLNSIVLELRRQNTEIIIIIGNILTSLICVSISNKLIDIYDMNACKILKEISTTIHNENSNKELAIAKVKNIRWFTETLKLINNYNETDFYL